MTKAAYELAWATILDVADSGSHRWPEAVRGAKAVIERHHADEVAALTHLKDELLEALVEAQVLLEHHADMNQVGDDMVPNAYMRVGRRLAQLTKDVENLRVTPSVAGLLKGHQ